MEPAGREHSHGLLWDARFCRAGTFRRNGNVRPTGAGGERT